MHDVTAAWRCLATELEAPSVARPFAHLVRLTGARVVGIAGPPGAGKSTFARLVADELRTPEAEVLVMSLDDFYLSREERSDRGLRWRGPPGSHDLQLLLTVLDGIREHRSPMLVPRFSAEADDRAEPVTVDSSPDHVLLDGWVLGHRGDGYDQILERLDLLVFLDVDEHTARSRRFSREAQLRERGAGFSEADMQAFWDEVLEPGMSLWVRDARESADLVIEVHGDDRLKSVRTGHDGLLTALRGPG